MSPNPTRLPILAALLLVGSTLFAQLLPRLWGMTTAGGTNNKGTIFHIDGDGTDFTVVYHFGDSSGYSPEGTLSLASNGKLYGTTNLGGSGVPGGGTLFSFDPGGGGFEKLVDFNVSNGGFGWGGMIAGTDGMLYGATFGGGSGGSIFRVDPSDDSYTILYALDGTLDGAAIEDRLFQRADGWFYGAASQGGANDAGTLFRYDPVTDDFEKLHDFDGGANGRTPYGMVCDAADGWLYGAAWEGGTENEGILYKYDPVGDDFVKLVDFIGTNGQSPWNGPVRIGPDLLYGTVALGGSNGGGLIYRYIPSTEEFSEEFSFNNLDGGLLFGSVLPASDGLFYGMASFGGTTFEGTVYGFDPVTQQMVNLHSFAAATDGYSPRGDLIEAGVATGFEELEAVIHFNMHPNPTSGTLSITLGGAPSSAARLRIMNTLGQVIEERAINSVTTVLDLRTPAGIYMVTLSTSRTSTSKVLVVE